MSEVKSKADGSEAEIPVVCDNVMERDLFDV